jgi:hypothetical protein
LRLIPDQFALERQVQIACDTVKLSHSYLTGKAAQPQEAGRGLIRRVSI